MPSLKHALMVIHAAAMVALLVLSFGPGLSCASPAPMPLPLVDAQYLRNNLAGVQRKQGASPLRTTSEVEHPDLSKRPVQPRYKSIGGDNNINSAVHPPMSQRGLDARLLDFITLIGDYCTTANDKATTFHEFLTTSSPGDSNNEDFRNTCSNQLTDLNDVLGNMHTVLLGLDAQKGLAFYDPSSELQTTIKDTVNYIKNLLSEVSDVIDDNSVLGDLLGKLVYDVKCLTDAILNAVENIVDSALSELGL